MIEAIVHFLDKGWAWILIALPFYAAFVVGVGRFIRGGLK